MRVHELAKELGVPSKELIATLKGLGVEVSSHMSALEEDVVDLIREESAPSGKKPAASPAGHEVKEEPRVGEEPGPEHETKAKKPAKAEEPVPEPEKSPAPLKGGAAVDGKTISVSGSLLVKELAACLGKRPNEIITELMRMNVLASINQRLDFNVAKSIAEKHGFTLEHEKKVAKYTEARNKESVKEPEEDKPEDLRPRPPVVTFLGHVDHGKTSLLDKVRDSSVVDDEHGGITQHIGAYTVEVGGRSVSFLDTPGHEAFTAMRARGADLTDIAIIVIAADDGIMPQTREAISHAKASGVTIMVAINKMDLPGANPTNVKQQLQAENLAPEEWGGQTICAEVSAQTGAGIDHLLEMIVLQADLLELKANPNREASGYVVESQLEPGMGPTANLLVKNGTLKVGDALACGPHWGRVRALINDHGAKVKSAGPSIPVKCLGLSGVPEAGAEFRVYKNDKAAREAAANTAEDVKADRAAPRTASLDALFDQIKKEEQVQLNLILKADTQGSLEAIEHALNDIKSDKVSIKTILGSTGNVTVNDVMLAKASRAVIMGFHVAKEPGVESSARHEGVDVRLHNVIYELLDEVTEAMTGLLSPVVSEKVMGRAEVRQVFALGKRANIAGCMIVSGIIRPSFKARVKRDDETLFDGSMISLKHFQDDVAEVREAQECGIRLEGFNDFKEGDILECYELESKAQTL